MLAQLDKHLAHITLPGAADRADGVVIAVGPVDLEELSGEFIEVAANYGERQGISYAAWRDAGVPAAVLRDAGIGRNM